MAEEVTERIKEKETEKSAGYMMKNVLQGRTLYYSSDKKSHKILQMFHRKVHSEGPPVEPKSENHLKHVTKGNQMLFEDITLFPKAGRSKLCKCNCMNFPVGKYV
ncbi:hypothetical protein L1987_20870 [Smallanthus sonchifolius]|uniref:Uncharacterized protein n=1 Tax=Smallanthus sonchifolius TaxID=185202 RepID=A0ACB9IU10_9ASTR|nr:hypothetical protein L1987_20870 [Smallanthus sonchifolius]